jgi:hypothetical protein
MNRILLITLFTNQAFCSTMIQYRLGINYGQIFYDYSGNGEQGTNGNSHLSKNFDTIPTDRGAYFNSSEANLITLPSNSKVSTQFTFPNTFTGYIWVFSEANSTSTQEIFVNYNISYFLIVSRVSNDLRIGVKIAGNYSSCSSSDSSFLSSKI